MSKTARKATARMEPYALSAREVATKRAADAREWAAPRLDHAAESVQTNLAPKVSSALSTTAHRLEPTREEARQRGTAALAALQGRKPKRRRWTLALLFFGLGSLAGAAIGMLARKPNSLSGSSGPAADAEEETPVTRRPDEPATMDGQPRGA